MVSREIWEKHALMSFSKTQIELVLRTRAILYVFEKLTRACFSQIALETILLPILIECLCSNHTILYNDKTGYIKNTFNNLVLCPYKLRRQNM